MNKEEILNTLSEMKARAQKSELSYADRHYIQSIYGLVLRKAFGSKTCTNRYKDAYVELYLHLQKNDIMEKSNYLLKNGVILQMPGDPNIYTNQNLTDEAAERYLADNPNRIALFASFPPNWNAKIIEAKAQEDEEQTLLQQLVTELQAKNTKTAIKEKYKTVEIAGQPISPKTLSALLKQADEIIKAEKQ